MNSVLKNFKSYPLTKLKAWDDIQNSIKLDWNESDETIPDFILKKSIEELSNYNLNWYPPIINEELEKAISQYVKLDTKYIRYAASSDVIHEYLCLALLNPGDTVLILNPTYDNFRKTAELNRARISYFDLDDNFNLDQNLFLSEIKRQNPQVVYLVNPNNPTGAVISNNFINELLIQFPEVYFILDEAYFEFYGVTSAELVIKYQNIIITRSLSKAFGAASIRFGYLISSEKITLNIDKVINPKNVPLFTQILAKNILENSEYIHYRISLINENKSRLMKIFDLKNIKYLNSQANFLFIKCDSEEQKLNIISQLEAQKIYVRNYSHLSSTSLYFRITIGSSEKFKNVLSHFEKF